jgi:two-component system, LytTR family, sensor kinase
MSSYMSYVLKKNENPMKSLRFNNLFLASIFVWFWYIGVTLPIYFGLVPPLSMSLSTLLMNYAICAVVFYVNYYVLTPFFVKRHEYSQLFLMLFVLAIIVLIIREGIDKIHYFGILQNGKPFSQIMHRTMAIMGFLMISSAFSVVKRLSENQKELFNLEKSKLEAELAFLKTQINPHFLFNTLNNIYSLAYLKDEKAAPMIAKLSNMLRYMLYECAEARVPLSKEVAFLKNYMDLQAVKAESSLMIDFFAENVLPEHQVAPLILINFVENAFKHSHWESHPNAWVTVHLEVSDEHELVFEVSNCKNGDKQPATRHHGIGLTNTKKQLELNYPNRHTLEISDETDSYNILLKINLNIANT